MRSLCIHLLPKQKTVCRNAESIGGGRAGDREETAKSVGAGRSDEHVKRTEARRGRESENGKKACKAKTEKRICKTFGKIGFVSEETYHLAILPERSRSKLEREEKEYESQCLRQQSEQKLLEKQVSGKTYTDTTELNERLKAEKQALKEAEKTYMELHTAYENDRSVPQNCRRLSGKREKNWRAKIRSSKVCQRQRTEDFPVLRKSILKLISRGSILNRSSMKQTSGS